ncbi:peptide/nickel transport system substrate-binding protein [Antricoccus suffuscus]|uniref:Peptide/nickel transport system substrate-binding protein n=1 Tax=Antricoccus suffuscus TaxID=1629062 RepID=A0A2T0ZVV8_9ACTN|nr:ABC transporter substrate-binding protein [Antricoccus suffuscus]PRZ40482.1 peptide/nickel transport system substrate-binding protein [Antricoccus suffuscus]
MRVSAHRTRFTAGRPNQRTNGPRRSPTIIATLTLIVALIVTGCSAGASSDGNQGSASAAKELRAKGDGTLTIYNSYTIAGLDPAGTGTNWLFDWGVAENLLQVEDDGSIKPWLAKDVSRDGDTRWVVTLRDGVTFQNGNPVDAEAVAAALTRQIAKSKAAQVYLDTATTVIAEGDKVILTTPAPNAMVPAALAARDNSLQIYDVSVMDAAGGDSSKIVGKGAYSGPYEITAWDPDNLQLKPFAKHWEGKPPLKGITVKVVPDEQARIAGVKSGEADMAFYPSTSAKLELQGDPEAAVLSSKLALQSLLVEMNLKAGIFTDVNVRKAFTEAIDYKGIADDVGNGQFKAAESLYPTEMPFALKNQKFDLKKAKSLLDDAGWTVGSDGIREKDGQKLTVRFVTQAQGPETVDVAIAMKDQVAKAGFDLEINNAEDSAAVKKGPNAWESSVALSGSLSGTADPIQPYLVRWVTGGSSNAQGITNPTIDKIGDQLRGEFDDSKRDQLLKDAQKILVADEAYVVAGTYKYFTVVVGPAWVDYKVSSVRRHITSQTGK